MQNKKYLKEVDIVRAIACLCVVSLHAINFVIREGNIFWIDIILANFVGLLSFGTTTFIFISGLILAYSYPSDISKDFYLKRFQFIVLPFVFTCLIFAGYNSTFGSNFLKLFVYNLIGYQHWFVLVVLQFYILYPFLLKIYKNFEMKIVLSVSFIINFLFLSVFNFLESPSTHSLIDYIWRQGYWVAFPGWLFFFSASYFAGKNYPFFIEYIKRNRKIIYLLIPITLTINLIINETMNLQPGSKRVDMIFFSIVMILFLFLLASKFNTPKILTLVSRYSFGIYLFHYLFLDILNNIFIKFELYPLLGYLSIFIMIIVSVLISIFIIYMFNKARLGKYLTGQVKLFNEKNVSFKVHN